MTIRYLSFLFAWIAYITLLDYSGVLASLALPPRIGMFIIIPIVVIIILASRSNSFQPVLAQTPLVLPVFLQSFRIVVELLIYRAFLAGILPQRATFEGLNFDIIVGLSAPLIAFLVWKKKISHRGLLSWNILALMVLGLTVYSFIHTFYFTDYGLKMESFELMRMPFLLLPAVLLPMAVFLHVFSIRQILLDKQGS